MTDLDLLRAMLTRAGVVFEEMPSTPRPAHAIYGPPRGGAAVLILLIDTVSAFYFDAAGALVAVGAWE